MINIGLRPAVLIEELASKQAFGSLLSLRIIIGNTAQFKAHGLLEYYSVSLPKKSRQGVSLTLIYLYNLTINLAAQSAHLNYAVLP